MMKKRAEIDEGIKTHIETEMEKGHEYIKAG